MPSFLLDALVALSGLCGRISCLSLLNLFFYRNLFFQDAQDDDTAVSSCRQGFLGRHTALSGETQLDVRWIAGIEDFLSPVTPAAGFWQGT